MAVTGSPAIRFPLQKGTAELALCLRALIPASDPLTFREPSSTRMMIDAQLPPTEVGASKGFEKTLTAVTQPIVIQFVNGM
jgi:hypothetical protein